MTEEQKKLVAFAQDVTAKGNEVLLYVDGSVIRAKKVLAPIDELVRGFDVDGAQFAINPNHLAATYACK